MFKLKIVLNIIELFIALFLINYGAKKNRNFLPNNCETKRKFTALKFNRQMFKTDFEMNIRFSKLKKKKWLGLKFGLG